ncbi:PIN domain-containing protein [Zestomonas thermotolerans]|uniref:PIN domain-containing protein n=1 Tax=Zestomonas thermotolerans TaxID=157784 RepID=UPI0003725FD7|nr:PIN domain-containing protein [Pseudomonas thermotolerans]
MANKYAMIDLENVQPASLQKLRNEGYQLRIFVGAHQPKISVDLAGEIQEFGERAKYIRMQNSGKNALDFLIAFYMGQISSSEPDSEFVVISKDTGYDPLLKHMRSLGLKANRSAAVVSAAPAPKPAAPSSQKKSPAQMSAAERVTFAIQYLKKAGKAKPATRKTLGTALDSAFQRKLGPLVINDLINELTKQGVVIDKQGSLIYQLNS